MWDVQHPAVEGQSVKREFNRTGTGRKKTGELQ
jgi:hypothetical protein